MFFMASALYVCSRPVISPLLRELLSGGGHVASTSASSVDSPAHSLAFCGVILALYALAVVSRHFPDSRAVSLVCLSRTKRLTPHTCTLKNSVTR